MKRWYSRPGALIAWGGLCLLLQLAHATAADLRPLNVRDLATLRDADGLSLSPDGTHVAFQVRQADVDADRYHTEWFVVRITDDASLVSLGDGGEPFSAEALGEPNGVLLAEPPAWSPDGEWLAYRMMRGGQIQIWRARRDGTVREQLTHLSKNALAPAWAADGKAIYFHVNRWREQLDERLAAEGARGFLYDERFRPFSGARPTVFESHGEPELWIYDLSTRVERPAITAEIEAHRALTAPPAVTQTPSVRAAVRNPGEPASVAWLEARDPQRQGPIPPLTVIAQPDGAASGIVCGAPECTGEFQALWWRNRREIVFLRLEGVQGEEQGLYSWIPGESAVRLISKVTGWLQSCQLRAGRMVCFHETPTQPRRVVALDLDTGALKTLFDPNPDFHRFRPGKVSKLQWKTRENIPVFGQLVLPPDYAAGTRLPLVIATYRFRGFLRGGTGDEYPVHVLAGQGFAVLCFDEPRLREIVETAKDAYEYDARTRITDAMKRAMQDGLDSAVELLDKQGIIDRQRVGLTGLSFGSETTHYALFHMPGLTTAITSGPGFDPVFYYLGGDHWREMLRTWGLQSPPGSTAKRWEQLSVSPNVPRIRASLLINASDSEYILAVPYVTEMKNAGKAVEMYVFPDSLHIKSRPAHRLAIYERNVDWLNFWLRDREDPDPGKAAQYERWRELRRLREADLRKPLPPLRKFQR